MQDGNYIPLQIDSLQPAQRPEGFMPREVPYSSLARIMEQKQKQGQDRYFPEEVWDVVKTFFAECRDQFVEIRKTPKKLTDSNDKSISFLESKKTEGESLPQHKCELKPTRLGSHALHIKAATDADTKIKALQTALEKQCLDAILDARKSLKEEIGRFNIEEECKKFAKDKWTAVCGGSGQINLFDRNYVVTRPMDNSRKEIEDVAGTTSIRNLKLSSSLFSIAYHKSEQIIAAAEALDAAKEAEKRKVRQDALAKKSAAEAAASNRPTDETQTSIRNQMTKEITAKVMKDIEKRFESLNFHAAPLQFTQRGATASRGRGRGREPGGENTATQQPPTPNRGRGGGRGGDRGRNERTTLQTEMPPRASNFRGRQPSPSASPRRRSPQPPQGQRRVSSSPNPRPPQGANVSNSGSGRGRGTADRGRGKGRGRGQTTTSVRPPQ
jgi:hypothetical protein